MTIEHSEMIQLKAGMKAFFRIMTEWKLNQEQQRKLLGDPNPTIFLEWMSGEVKDEAVSIELLDRLSYILGIYKSLKIMFSEENQKLFLINPTQLSVFNNSSPLEYMLSGQLSSLANVRLYLERNHLWVT